MKISRKTIFVIEDEAALLHALEARLSIEGFNVITSSDGKEGIENINLVKPDLVVLDILLPRMNGLEVLKNLKGNPETKSIPVIVISNISDESDIEKAKKLGAQDYLIKADYKLDEIVEKIKEIIDVK